MLGLRSALARKSRLAQRQRILSFQSATCRSRGMGELPYVQPDALLDYGAAMHLFLSRAKFEQTSRPCVAEGCTQMAVSGVGQCLRHHIEGLRKVRSLPEP